MRRKNWIGDEERAIRTLSRFRIISLSSVVYAAVRYRSWSEIQILSESIGLVVFGHVSFLYID